MTPPERELVVYVCPRPKCEAVTVIPVEELPEGFAGSICYGDGRWHEPVMKVQHVPASRLEQVEKERDELVEFLIEVEHLQRWVAGEPGSRQLNAKWIANQLGKALASYREKQ